MSIRYKGGILSATPPTLVAGAGASGAWTLEQQMQATAAGLWPVNGPFYIEEVFSTYLYTGNGGTQTITNGIDLATKGGLWWGKSRSTALGGHGLVDTVRGKGNMLQSNTANAPFVVTTDEFVTSFNTNGVTIGLDNTFNRSGATTVGWTFAKQPKFFDIVTYTGNGTAGRTVAHNLGSVPGCIIVKRTDTAADWKVYHRGINSGVNPELYTLLLNWSDAAVLDNSFNNTAPTSTVFSVSASASVNASGGTYVAYLFAHNAGGFGLTGTDNVISCGSFTGSSTSQDINLGYEPQWLLYKKSSAVGDWTLIDNMRAFSTYDTSAYANIRDLFPNKSNAEVVDGGKLQPTATGFSADEYFTSGATYIYIAIRRGPMKTPTVGTSVFGLNARSGTGANATVAGGQTDDAVLIKNRGSAVASLFSSRLTGTGYLVTSSAAAEVAAGTTILQANPWDVMDGVQVGTTSTITNATSNTYINYLFKRAPSVFDVVCYTGTGPSPSIQTVNHNLGVTPELIILKGRSAVSSWPTNVPGGPANAIMFVDATAASYTGGQNWSLTSTTFKPAGDTSAFAAGTTYVAYLFATVAGVSKVGSYTGTAALLTVNCGFTTGARFVLIKRTDVAGGWYTYDSSSGITSGNDPYILLNSTAAQVTGTNYVDTDTTGFKVTAAAPAELNASGGNYIFLAIA